MEYIIALGIGMILARNKEYIIRALGGTVDSIHVNATREGPFDKDARVPEPIRQGQQYSTSTYLSRKYS